MGPERNMTCLSRVATFLQGQKKKTERKREKKTEEEKEEEEGVEEWKEGGRKKKDVEWYKKFKATMQLNNKVNLMLIVSDGVPSETHGLYDRHIYEEIYCMELAYAIDGAG